MAIRDTIRTDLTEAMKARDENRVQVLRSVLSGFTNELVAQKRKPDEPISDEHALGVIKRSVKQRKDSIEQFRKGGREDLAQKEEAELEILETYLPEQLGEDEIRPLAQAKKEELGVADKAQAGKLMGALMQDLKGNADGDDVKRVVDSLFE